jgi:hypothetical protein
MMGRKAIGSAASRVVLILAFVVAIAATAIDASAAGKAVPSKLNVVTTTEVTPKIIVGIGTVTSGQKKCVGNRRVKLIVKNAQGSKLVDLARTSDHGGWEAKAKSSDFVGFKSFSYKLLPRTINVGGKQLKCGKDKVVAKP